MLPVRVEVKGLREIRRAMLELPKRIDTKILNAGLLEGARLVRDEARDLAPVLRQPDPRYRPGMMRRAIQAVAVKASRRQYAAEVLVRVRKLTKSQIAAFKKSQAKKGRKADARRNPGDPFYWFFVEFGTARTKAQPFLRPAFESRKAIAVDKAVMIFRERVQAEIQKLGRTAGV